MANERATNGRPLCPRCGEPVRRGPRAKWCSETCRVRMWQERRQARQGGPERGRAPARSAESTVTRNLRVVQGNGVIVLPRDSITAVLL